MALEMVATAPRRAEFREFEVRPPRTSEVLIRAEYGAAKHGTEMNVYRGGSPRSTGRWDRQLQLFVPLPDGGGPESSGVFPLGLGNMIVGRVAEVGSAVTRWKPGDRVFCHSNFREAVLRPEHVDHGLNGGLQGVFQASQERRAQRALRIGGRRQQGVVGGGLFAHRREFLLHVCQLRLDRPTVHREPHRPRGRRSRAGPGRKAVQRRHSSARRAR